MAKIEGHILIDRPVEEVFDFVADSRNEPSFNPAMASVELLTPLPIRRGTRFRARIGRGERHHDHARAMHSSGMEVIVRHHDRGASACRPAGAEIRAIGVHPLILLPVLAHDSQQSQQVQQPESPPPDGRDEHVEVRHGQD